MEEQRREIGNKELETLLDLYTPFEILQAVAWIEFEEPEEGVTWQ